MTQLRQIAILVLAFVISFPVFAKELGRETRIADSSEAKIWSDLARLIERGDDANAAQRDGMTALHWAVYHGHSDSVRRLIAAKCNVDAKTRYNVTPLSIACRNGNSEIVRELLVAGADANLVLSGGETPLMIASRTGNADTIRHLIKHGAKTDASERKQQTALMWAASAGNVKAVDALIEAGANVNASLDSSGFSAMTFAAREGRSAVVKRLLRAGVDPNAAMQPKGNGKRVPRKGTSALLMAVESGHLELAMFLVESGADPNDQRSGYTPMHAIVGVRKPNRGEEPDGDPPPRGSGNLTSLQFARAIVAAGADVNTRLKKGKGGKAVLNREGATPLLLAAKTADLPLMQLLVELGADPSIANVDGCTPLMAAAGIGVRAVGEEAGTEPEVLVALQFLLAHGLDVNTVDANKETAMHGAAYRCYPKVIEFLAERGADPNVWDHKNKFGWTPVMIGQGHRPGSFKPSPETVRALQAAMKSL